jgi:glucose/arabinose dehydrogenase
MNEDEVAAKLAATVDPPTTAPELPSDPKPEPREDEAFHDNLPLETVMDKMKLQDYFEVPALARRSAEVETQLNRIVDWARDEARSSDYADILRVISDQERIMGIKLKDNRMTKLFQYVTINSQRKRLMEAERALFNG